jgi:hypothetical protein
MLQQQQQSSDNVGGGGGEDDEEGDQHEVNKRDVYLVENNTENMVEKDVNLNVEQHKVNNRNVYENENDENIFNFTVDSDYKFDDNFENKFDDNFENNIENDGGNEFKVSDESDGVLTSLNEERLTSFFNLLKSLKRSKRSSPSTAGSVCAPVRSANP